MSYEVPFKTPVGEAIWPKLDRPDTRFDEGGVYTVDLRLDPNDPEVLDFIETLNAVRDEGFALEKAENPKISSYNAASVFKDEYDADGNPTGMIIVKAKMKAEIYSKKQEKTFAQQPRVFTSANIEYDHVPSFASSGCHMQVRGTARAYSMGTTRTYGVSLRLKDVRVMKEVLYEGATIGWDD